MKTALLGVVLLWQLAASPGRGGVNPEHLRYLREVHLPAKTAGQACVALDADVFAHAASSTVDDLRVFASRPGGNEREVPFALTESEARPDEDQTATVRHAEMRDGSVTFDLAMPGRAYTEVDLEIAAKDFLGEATVWGLDGRRPEQKLLGNFSIFDLSGEGLARSTGLALPESVFPILHVELRLRNLKGGELAGLSAEMVKGAEVPPSRVEQTLYTTVAASSNIESQGLWSLATLTVPAHVPLERVRFLLDPKFKKSFLRDVLIAATPKSSGYDAVGAAESVSGKVYQISRDGMAGGMAPIHVQHLFVDAILGSNLRSSAKVLASVRNGGNPPLPIESVELQMRERRVCFQAARGASYELGYGDAALRAPVYSYDTNFRAVASPVMGELGPERVNPRFVLDTGRSPNEKRPSEVPWVVLIGVILIGGVVALQRMRKEEMQ